MSRPHFLQPFLRGAGAALGLRNVRTGLPIATHVETAFDSSARRRGLLRHDRFPPDHAMVIAPSSLVHTFGMRFSIDMLFVARNGMVLKVRRAVPPRRIAGRIGSFAVVELAVGQIDASDTRIGDTIEAVPL